MELKNRSTSTRRRFLKSIAFTFAAASLGRAVADVDAEARIVRAVGFELPTRRSKVAGKNSRLDVHGDSSSDPMLRLYTSSGVEGLGVCRASRENVAKLLGQSPASLLQDQTRRISSALGRQTMPLWDLLGKLREKPVCELLRAPASDVAPRVGVYDGSIYFADLLPQYADAWEERFKREIDMGLALGHRAFKIKIGRGAKWMERAEGDARDVAVVRTIRQHGGREIILGVDANNGYDLAGAKRFVEQTAECDLAFTEEMFPEVVEECLAYKQFLRENNLKTLLADGETQHELSAFEPFVKARAIDVLQGDMNHFGVEGILAEADMARPQGILIAPHNWGSLMGFYQQLHIGAAVDNFYRAEHDPLTTDLLTADGYHVDDGMATVSNAPGFGLRIDEDRFAREAKIRFDIKT